MPPLQYQVASTIPANAGVGLKPQHFSSILEHQHQISWFEIHAENYMSHGGAMHHHLTNIRDNYPLSIHGVGLSLGSAAGVCDKHLAALKQLVERYQPGLVSEHLSWSRFHATVLNDLLPMPYTDESLNTFGRNIDHTQTTLGRQILIENPSSYFELKGGQYSEAEFLVTLAQRSGCKILLDVNNIYVSACNHGFDAKQYIKSIPSDLVGEIHLAGHSVQQIVNQGVTQGEVRIDDHGSKTCDAVWQLYQLTLAHIGERPTLIEWDTNVPTWQVLHDEAMLAQRHLDQLKVVSGG